MAYMQPSFQVRFEIFECLLGCRIIKFNTSMVTGIFWAPKGSIRSLYHV